MIEFVQVNYKDAPKGTMAIIPAPDSTCAGCIYRVVIGECHKPFGPRCIGDVRHDSTEVIFVRPASEHYARIALERVYESIEVSVHKAQVEIEALATQQVAEVDQHSFGPLDRMLFWLDIKYDLFGN